MSEEDYESNWDFNAMEEVKMSLKEKVYERLLDYATDEKTALGNRILSIEDEQLYEITEEVMKDVDLAVEELKKSSIDCNEFDCFKKYIYEISKGKGKKQFIHLENYYLIPKNKINEIFGKEVKK